jgi:hypothetical protein
VAGFVYILAAFGYHMGMGGFVTRIYLDLVNWLNLLGMAAMGTSASFTH